MGLGKVESKKCRDLEWGVFRKGYIKGGLHERAKKGLH